MTAGLCLRMLLGHSRTHCWSRRRKAASSRLQDRELSLARLKVSPLLLLAHHDRPPFFGPTVANGA